MTGLPIEPVDVILLAMLVAAAVAISRSHNLLATAMLTGIFSLLGACWMTFLDAPDVAFTEAAVGAGISTVLMLATLALTKKHEEKPPAHQPWLPLIVIRLSNLDIWKYLSQPIFICLLARDDKSTEVRAISAKNIHGCCTAGIANQAIHSATRSGD